MHQTTCAQTLLTVPYLAEAKGRTSSISFNSRDFQAWRRQFERILVLNDAGVSCILKGFVVATRFGTELQGRVRSRIYVDDPQTLGREAMTSDDGIRLTNWIKAIHYSYLASKLDQPILAASLRHGFLLPEEIRVIGTVWTSAFPPLRDQAFVGGYYLASDDSPWRLGEDGKVIFRQRAPFRLGVPRGTFFGLDETTFRSMVDLARRGSSASDALRPQGTDFVYSAISRLRDGSIVAPIEFFAPTGTIAY
jgi:hypothetical protein